MGISSTHHHSSQTQSLQKHKNKNHKTKQKNQNKISRMKSIFNSEILSTRHITHTNSQQQSYSTPKFLKRESQIHLQHKHQPNSQTCDKES